MKVYVIHGPNMNMLGIREPDIYGRQTYDDLVEYIRARCEENGMEPEFFQSNHEGTLVDIIQQAYYKSRCDNNQPRGLYSYEHRDT